MSYEKELEKIADDYVFSGKSYEICLMECEIVAMHYKRDPSWSAVDFEEMVRSAEKALHRECLGLNPDD